MGPNIKDSRLAVVLHGRVQGVGFRWWTCSQARRLDLRGTVRNLPDGSVEVHAAGTEESLDVFLVALRTGPPGARVLGERHVQPTGDLPQDFRVIA